MHPGKERLLIALLVYRQILLGRLVNTSLLARLHPAAPRFSLQAARQPLRELRIVPAQAAQQALRRLCQRPGVLDGTTAGITVSFEGLGSFAAYQQVLRALGALPGVSRLEPRRFVGAATPAEERVQVLLQAQGGSEALGAALGRALLPGLRLQVMPLPGGDLRVLVAPDGALPTGAPEPAAPAGESPGEPPSEAAPAGAAAEKGAP